MSVKNYQNYQCKQSNIFFIVCHKCKKHENAQDWMRVNHNPKIGVKNLDIMFNVLGTNQVQINSVSIKPYNKPEYGISQIEELDHNNEENDPTMEYEEEVNANPITVNR